MTQSDETIAQLSAILNSMVDDADRHAQQMRSSAQQFTAIWLGMGGNVTPPPTVKLFSQRDPRWATVRLGTSASSIGGYGCLITCVASMLSDAGKLFNPETLNAWLIHNNGYISGNLFVFTSVDKLGVVKYEYMVECATKAAPIAQLDQEIQAGKFVIVKVDFNPTTMAVEEHWVRYLGNGQCMDPWVGDIAPIVPRYRGADAAQAILKCDIYRRTIV